MNLSPRRYIPLALGLVLLCTGPMTSPIQASDSEPSTEKLITDIFRVADLDERGHQDMMAGAVVEATLPALSGSNVFLALIAFIKAPLPDTAASLKGEATTETGNEPMSVSVIPDKGKFPAFGFDKSAADEVTALLKFSGGEEFNLSEHEITQLHAVRDAVGNPALSESDIATVSQAYRQFLERRYQKYRDLGLAGVESYARGKGKTLSVQDEMRLVEENLLAFEGADPRIYGELRAFPKVSGEFVHIFYLYKKTMNKRSQFILTHGILDETNQRVFSVYREFFVGHTYNTLTTFTTLLPYQKGTLVVMATDLFTEKVTGGMGGVKRSVGRKKLKAAVMPVMESLRNRALRSESN